jgi:hypothetical protein
MKRTCCDGSGFSEPVSNDPLHAFHEALKTIDTKHQHRIPPQSGKHADEDNRYPPVAKPVGSWAKWVGSKGGPMTLAFELLA